MKLKLQNISSRIPPNDLAEYPNWLFLFFYQNILPMLGLGAIAMKIILKNGKELQRELIGVKAKRKRFLTEKSTCPPTKVMMV